MNDLTPPRRALIIGGGSGLGLAASFSLAAQGWKVFLSGRRRDPLIAAHAMHAPGQCEWQAADGTVEAEVKDVVQTCVRRFGGLEALVVSAGVSATGSVVDANLEQLEQVFRSNVWPTFLYSQAVVPHLRAKGGAICVVASISATMPQRNRVAYCSSKAAQVGMVRQMALDLAPFKIRVNAVSPSLVMTDLSRKAIADSPDPAFTLAARIGVHPLGRIGDANEVGQAVAYLCSSNASWITGQNLIMDGGRGLMPGMEA